MKRQKLMVLNVKSMKLQRKLLIMLQKNQIQPTIPGPQRVQKMRMVMRVEGKNGHQMEGH